MGFYGNITNTSHTHFQFDKIFENRTAMDTAAALGTDGIFAGRFVLVKYDPNSGFFEGDIPLGYLSGDHIYLDASFLHPFVYTTFTRVTGTPDISDWEDYYYSIDGNNFYKLPSVDYFNENETNYYISTATGDNLIGAGLLVRLREESSGAQTLAYYRCVSGTVGEPAVFNVVLFDDDTSTYLINFNIDKVNYGNDFDPRGYDATVWQKTYSEGNGSFILIAYLNALIPDFEISADAPQIEPSAPYVDSVSGGVKYKIHVPTMWGLLIKEEEDEDKSDLIVTLYKQEYNSYTGEYTTISTTVNGAIYFNKIASDVAYRTYDETTANEILIERTGESGRTYYDSEGHTATIDTLDVSIHMPAIGNMITDGYDIIYGVKDDGHTRPRDINWYSGDSSIELRTNGNGSIGGKTYNLETLAGVLNTWHLRLGLIIVPYSTRPASLGNLSTDNIYYIADENKYFRLGTTYLYTPLSISNNLHYTFIEATDVTSENYMRNTYYLYNLSTDSYTPSMAEIFDSSATYYKKNVAAEIYHIVTPPLVRYESGEFFLKRGADYIRDNAVLPTSPLATYYTIDENIDNLTNESTDLIKVSGASFNGQYLPNTYYYIDEDDNYIRDSSELPTHEFYYNISLASGNTIYNNAVLYQKGKFYYQYATNRYNVVNYDTLALAKAGLGNNAVVYWLEFDETEDIVTVYYDENDELQTIIGHPLKEAHPLTLSEMVDLPNDTSNFYFLYNNNFIKFDNLDDYVVYDGETTVPVFARPRRYAVISNAELLTNLFLSGKYHYLDGEVGVGSYILATDWDSNIDYYYIKSTSTVNSKFYLPDTYYYESSSNYYEIDTGSRMTIGRDYYTKVKLYVLSDEENRSPYGYEWSDLALFVPASVTLGYREETLNFIEIKNFLDGTGSLNGHLLTLENLLSTDNSDTRDKNTLKGCLNIMLDYLYPIGKFIPQRMVYINDFGQITSSKINYGKLKLLVDKADEILASLE